MLGSRSQRGGIIDLVNSNTKTMYLGTKQRVREWGAISLMRLMSSGNNFIFMTSFNATI